MLIAIMLMSIMTGIIVINYHYLAIQRQVDHQLVSCFLKQAQKRMQADNQGQQPPKQSEQTATSRN